MEVGHVANKEDHIKDARVRVFSGRGRTLMSGLGDAHAHFTWNGMRLLLLLLHESDLTAKRHRSRQTRRA